MLVDGGLIRRDGDRWQEVPPGRAVISLSQPQPDQPATAIVELVDPMLRETILRHELSHGEFFTNPAYADYCFGFWRGGMTQAERDAFTGFLGRAGYDTADEAMMVNEMQAFLAHTPDPRVFSAAMLGIPEERVDAMRRQFWDGRPPIAAWAN